MATIERSAATASPLLRISLCVLVLCSCSMDREEVARSSSPDNRLVAIHVNAMGGGAAGSMAEEIYVVEQGSRYDRENPIFSASHCKIISMQWLNDQTLEIHFDAPCSVHKSQDLLPPRFSVGYQQRPPIEIHLLRDAPPNDSTQRAIMQLSIVFYRYRNFFAHDRAHHPERSRSELCLGSISICRGGLEWRGTASGPKPDIDRPELVAVKRTLAGYWKPCHN
jgi:hypothetical protein